MNYGDIVTLAESVGLNNSRAKVAAAIAMAESGGNPSAEVHDSDDDSYGLWQINMKGALGPTRRAAYGLPNNAILLDARRNAMVMAHISSNGGNFSAWTTYTSGKYKEFLQGQSAGEKLGQAVDGVRTGVDQAAQNTAAIGAAAKNIAALTQRTAAWVSNSENWVRIAYILGGGIVTIVAVSHLMRSGGINTAPIASHARRAVKTVTKTVKG